MKVWIGGEIVEGAEARIPVTDHGLLYGDGIFEGLRVYAGAIFRLPDHLRRLGAAARAELSLCAQLDLLPNVMDLKLSMPLMGSSYYWTNTLIIYHSAASMM